ncbi:MAG: hypothetical protein KC800_31900 [Candidatus Eremiobacteraeota bacterium]|nr:hypothetical protein [Candidatus Eremiobacteraeota bacterium]
MKGSVTKRPNGSYLIRISIGRDENGKRLYHTETVNDTSKEAHRRKRDLIRQLETGGVVSPDKLSLNKYLAEWLEVAKKPKVSPRTLVGYQELVARYVADGIGKIPLPRVTVLHIQGLYSEMSERGLSGLTVRQVLATPEY